MKRFFSVKRFFSLCNWSYDYTFHTFETEEDAQTDIQALADAARAAPDGLDEADELVWGEIRGVVREDGQLTPVPPTPDPETERLRAELAAFRARVAAVLAELQSMEAYHRQAEKSLAHGEYSFERAEAYEYAADMLREALTVGGEE